MSEQVQKSGLVEMLSLFLLIWPLWSRAETAPAVHTPQLGAYAGQIALALGVVLGVIFAAAWALRRFAVYPARGTGLRVVSALSVGRNEKILLIEVGKQQLLVGVTESRISTLHVLEEPLELADNGDKQSGALRQRFEDVLRQQAPSVRSTTDSVKNGDKKSE